MFLTSSRISPIRIIMAKVTKNDSGFIFEKSLICVEYGKNEPRRVEGVSEEDVWSDGGGTEEIPSVGRG